MKCNTEKKALASGLDSEQWQALWQQLPTGWEAEAYRCAALVRRRGIGSARALLQMILAYAVGEKSLRQVGLWGTLSGVAAISDVAILNRLRQSKSWLETLVSAVLQERVDQDDWPAQRIHLVDATSISRPGHRGTDWRVHVSLDLAQMQIQRVILPSPLANCFWRTAPTERPRTSPRC